MKRFWIVMFCIAFYGNNMVAQQNHNLRVVLDPGHGGLDPGAIGVNGIKEKDIVLEVARELIRLNKELFDDRLDLYLTRYKDTLIPLSERSRLTKELKADIFISLHVNHASKSNVQGVEVYLQNPGEYTNIEKERASGFLAQSLLSNFDEFLGYKVRGIKHANFQVLRETQLVCPGALVELGYLSNKTEADHSSSLNSLSGLALAIIQALLEF